MASSRLGEPSTARSHSLLNAIISASNWSRPRRCSTRPFSYKRLIGSARIALPRDAETSLTLIKHEAIFDALDSGNTFCGHADPVGVGSVGTFCAIGLFTSGDGTPLFL